MKRALLSIFALTLAGASAAKAQGFPDKIAMASRFDMTTGYNFVHANAPPGMCGCFSMNGAFLSGSMDLNSLLGLTGQVTANHATDISALGQNLTLTTWMAGPRVTWHRERFSPYGQILAGEAHGTGSYFPSSNSMSYTSSASGFAYSAGLGLTYSISPRLGIRALDAQYLHTGLPNGNDDSQHHIQLSTGIIVRFGLYDNRRPTPPMIAPRY